MLSFINMECLACGAEYTLSIEELNVVVLFRCFDCGQYNLYVAGNMLELDQRVMNEGTEKEKQRHIVETTQVFACDFAGNVLNNVDRVINVNVEMELPFGKRKKSKRSKKKGRRPKEISGVRLSPSVKLADAPAITLQELRDFIQIDLNLIDKKEHFDRFFGGPKE